MTKQEQKKKEKKQREKIYKKKKIYMGENYATKATFFAS
jgi:hypothetical protein